MLTAAPDVKLKASDLNTEVDSPQWYRVAALRPRLRPHVKVQRREKNGEVSYMLTDADSGRHHRINRAAWEFVGRINGQIRVEQLWQHLHQIQGAAAPTQHEVVRLLSQLAEAELIGTDAMPDLQRSLQARKKREREKRLAAVNPLAFKLPLLDPTRALNAVLPAFRWLFSPLGFMLWSAWMLAALVTGASHGSELAHAATTQGLTPSVLLSMWLAYPVVKLVHEFGHALAVRAWGGAVREMGVTLMLLTPVPYTDASAATQFAQRHRRIMVSAMGIMAELGIAALALFVWCATQAPWLQQLCLALMLLCGVSTLLFNANPLARFDGYYMLCDALDLPNLARRADGVVFAWGQRLMGLRHIDNPADSKRQAAGLAAYSLAALGYRWLVGFAILIWLHDPYPLLALLVAMLLTAGLVMRPLWQGARFLLWDARLNGRRLRAWGFSALVLALPLGLLALAPVPSATVQPGVVWLPERAVLRAPVDGTVVTLHQAPGAQVTPGTLIATLDNLELRGERESAQAHVVQLDVQYYDALLQDPTRAQRLATERAAAQAQLEYLDARLAEMQIHSQVAGRLVLPRASEHEGRFLAQGNELGYVLDNSPPLIKVALTEAQAAMVRQGTARVTVRLANAPEQVLPARIEREVPGATRDLPSAALGNRYGGPIPIDPSDPNGRRAMQPVTLVDVHVDGPSSALMGLRSWVRFEHAKEPLATQWARGLRQLFLRSLGARS